MSKDIPNCPECGEHFANVFEACDHLLPTGQQFDPYLLMPGGYRLFLGSLMKEMYENADDPEIIEQICQNVYSTLFISENETNIIHSVLREEMIENVTSTIDAEYEALVNSNE
jgi:predicted amidophosphoribosyltransferase